MIIMSNSNIKSQINKFLKKVRMEKLILNCEKINLAINFHKKNNTNYYLHLIFLKLNLTKEKEN